MTSAKRALDVVGALVVGTALLPLCAVIAWRIRRHDGGPVLFTQERIGRGGRPFALWKFRTMVIDAERLGPQLTAAGDPRVTRVGAWLRRTKLDELPQLLNVLAGDMSLVGPRHEVAPFVARYSPAERAVLELTPGLTDPATLTALDEERELTSYADPVEGYVQDIMPEKIRQNLAYAAQASLLGDVRVLLATVRALAARAIVPIR